jgi:hypothetical protein
MATLTITDNTPDNFLLGNNSFENDVFTAGGANTYPKGLLLGRFTASGKLQPYVSGAADGTEIPIAVLAAEIVATGAGDTNMRPLLSGGVRQDMLTVWNGGTPIAVTQPEVDLLRDYAIIASTDRELLRFDNS